MSPVRKLLDVLRAAVNPKGGSLVDLSMLSLTPCSIRLLARFVTNGHTKLDRNPIGISMEFQAPKICVVTLVLLCALFEFKLFGTAIIGKCD